MAIAASRLYQPREARTQDLPPVNAKRVLRIMQVNGLVLTRHTAYRPARTHDGVVIALRVHGEFAGDDARAAYKPHELCVEGIRRVPCGSCALLPFNIATAATVPLLATEVSGTVRPDFRPPWPD